MQQDLSIYGGSPVYYSKGVEGGDPDEWNFGWIAPRDREAVTEVAHNEIMAVEPRMTIIGKNAFAGEKAFLWEFNKKARGGKHNPLIHQITGSCVGAGGGNAWMTLAAVEKIRLHEKEKAIVPFWLIPYGKSRQYAGMRGPGEGSLGSTFAKAAKEDGTDDAANPAYPQPTEEDGLVWGGAVERKWSDGAAIPESALIVSRKHVLKSTAQCRTADDVRDALVNGYPCTCASNWGGLMQCPSVGTPAIRLNRHSGTWNHQMSVQGYWDHPTEGEIYYILNNWGLGVHGAPLNDEPPGGFWIKKADMESICRQNEVFAFSQFDGFPANDIFSWLI